MNGSALDTLNITGIRAYGYVGFLPEEQILGQWYEVDLTLWLDSSKAGKSDRLEDTYDYRVIIQSVQELIRTERFKLIETLTEAIAQIVLQPKTVEQVRVRLTKVSPPIADFSGKVSLEITRSISSSCMPI
ncbi:MAG: dihydroneopterin aldolase [Leptolyngbyaceae cyanobacterium CRU_2_3]|nr:dihydroneopterin aldolase [Leptolyngbyaceae cyanobacterium CRU_2_3]